MNQKVYGSEENNKLVFEKQVLFEENA